MRSSSSEAFYRHLSFERGLSKNTCLAYARDAEHFLEHCRRNKKDPARADNLFLDEYFWKLKDAGRLKPASLFRKMEAVKAFYRFLLLEGRTTRDPTRNFKSPRLPERIPRFIEKPEMNEIMRVFPHPVPASRGEGAKKGGFGKIRTMTIVELLYATGMRISELLDLKLESVNIKQGWVRVLGKGGKERMIPMHKTVIHRIDKYIDARQERFGGKDAADELFVNRFGKKLSRVQVWKDIHRLGNLARLEKKLHPHLFRHTFASHLLQGGADLRSIQEMLGHASLNTTQVYTHLEKSDIKAAHKRAME